MGQTAFNLAEQAGFAAVGALLAGKGADRGPARFPQLSGPYLGQPPPGMTPQLFAKGIVSTRQGVYSTIVFSLEHGEAFWHPESEGVLFMKIEGGRWSAPRRFPFTARPSINVPVPLSGQPATLLHGGHAERQPGSSTGRRSGSSSGPPTAGPSHGPSIPT